MIALNAFTAMNIDRLSIIIPVYNGASVIAGCLESIFRSKVDVPFEVIVVDDGSTDATPDVVSKFPVRYFRISKAGVSKARNTGIKNATGDILLFFDADVILHDNTIERFITHFRNDSDASIVQGRWDKNHPSPSFANQFLLLRFTYNFEEAMGTERRFAVAELMTGCCGIRKEVFESFREGFDERYKSAGGEEFEFAIRLIQKFKIYYYPDILVYHQFGTLMQTARKVFFRTTNYAVLVFGLKQKTEYVELTANSVPMRDRLSVIIIALLLFGLVSTVFNVKLALAFVAVLMLCYLLNIRYFVGYLYKEKGLFFSIKGAASDFFMMFPRVLGLFRAGVLYYVFRMKDYRI
jgi:glycosyltransferase involved in cell wall biosynthesis